MSPEEIEMSAYQLLLKIHVIVGWTIPLGEMMDVLVDQFQKKLTESYSNVNPEEIEYAFRNRGLDVKDWGKALNLTLIDEVMIPYLTTRRDLSAVEESLSNKPAIAEKKDLTEEEWHEWLLDMKSYNLELLPIEVYEYLIRKDEEGNAKLILTPKDKFEFIDKAIPTYTNYLNKAGDLKELNDFVAQKQKGEITGKHRDALISLSKKMIVKDYLEKLF